MIRARLANLYPQLSSWERIRLLLAADTRQDDVEYQRLFRASPIRNWRFSEHLMAEQALHVLALTYIKEQLDAVASLFFALFQLMRTPEQDQDMELIAEVSAYYFTINSQAWESFSDGIRFPAKELVAANQDGWFLPYCEQMIPGLAPTAEELAAHHSLPDPLVTCSILAARWRTRLKNMVQSTPLDTPEMKYEPQSTPFAI